MSALFDLSGRPIILGAELGRGGEGLVHEVLGDLHSAAKVYLQPPGSEKTEKIHTMVGLANERLLRLTAWPTSTLHSATGGLVGFTMPRISGHRPIFQLYGPKQRLKQFPQADWRFLVHVAANVARAFGVVHASEHIVGDVNHGNLFVAPDGTVRFIDTDSFQISNGTRRWLCEVGVSTHQPPELQNLTSYRSVVRTSNHDAFGLAVMAFQLLCMGRHPFSGRFLGSGDPPDIERAIAACGYAYSRDQTRTKMAPAPATLPIAALGKRVEALFEMAFAPTSVQCGRPTAGEWVEALQQLREQLQPCGFNSAHWFAAQAGGCPWCKLEAQGAIFFPRAFAPRPLGQDDVAHLWQEILTLTEPASMAPLEPPDGHVTAPSAVVKNAHRRQQAQRLVAIAVGVLGTIAVSWVVPHQARLLPFLSVTVLSTGLFFFPRSRAKKDAAYRLLDANHEWSELEDDWNETATATLFRTLRRDLETIKHDYDNLAGEREQQIRSLAADRRGSQLASHLDNISLASARIAGIGKSNIATLLSYGIDSAADIRPDRIAPIPGFGPKRIASLVAFRLACEASFQFDPSQAVAPAEIAALDRDLDMKRVQLEEDLRTGLYRVRGTLKERAQRREALRRYEARLRPALAQAVADARFFGL